MKPEPEKSALKKVMTAFVTGLVFLAPVLLTAVVLAWLLENLIAIVGPESLIGQGLVATGHLFAADDGTSFLIGVFLLLALITGVGWLVMTKARHLLEEAVDGLIGRIPFLGGIYRPVAQLIRGMGNGKSEQMRTMSVCRICFGGGVETIGFLASPETFDLGGGPAKLVLIPTAPVPVGGALLLVPVAKVESIPSMKFDDLVKLYLTMGMSPPEQLRAKKPVTPHEIHPGS
ncbi:MAG: DUF502 domain-containing protein [Sphingomonadaceae bacterium]